MTTEWYDIDWQNERAELVEIEDATPITVPEELDETDDDEEVCSCLVSPELCLVHNEPKDEEN